LRIKHIAIIGLIAAGLIAAAAYGFRPAVVSVVVPKRGDAAEIVYASGVVEPRIWAKVTSLVRERLVEVCNCEAQQIEKGAVLARLDDSEANAVLRELEARLSLARENMSRLSILSDRRVASVQALDQARAEVDQIEALLAGQKARIEN
jgi:multidrug efflux pump subunit AcrA (membrane-fusion protein)